MSKLAHSNDETMYEIEMASYDMDLLKTPKKPRCEALVPRAKWLNDNSPCRRYARYRAKDGTLLCKEHAENHSRMFE